MLRFRHGENPGGWDGGEAGVGRMGGETKESSCPPESGKEGGGEGSCRMGSLSTSQSYLSCC